MGRWLFPLFMLVVFLGGAAWVLSLTYFGAPIAEVIFEVKGRQIVQVEFAPDGQKVAVVTDEVKPPEASKEQATRIYRASDGKPLHTLNKAAWRCDWNADGSLLVVSSMSGKDFDIYDTTNWQLKKHLTLTPPRNRPDPKDKSGTKDQPGPKEQPGTKDQAAPKDKADAKERPSRKRVAEPGDDASDLDANPGIVQALKFTRQGSLFVLTITEDTDSSYQLDHAKAWWDPLHSSAEAQSLGSCGGAWDLGVASANLDAMLALSYLTTCPPEILNVSPRGNSIFVQGKVEIKNLPHELVAPRLQLTPDGNYLVARDENRVDVLTLSGAGSRLVTSIEAPTKSVKGAMIFWKELALSRDGRYAAYATDTSVRVIRIPDGKQMLQVASKPCAFALAPDGSLLAVANGDRHTISLYHLP